MDFMSQRCVCLPHQQSYICKTKENRGNFIRWVWRWGNCIVKLQIRGGKKSVAIKRLNSLHKNTCSERGVLKGTTVFIKGACPNILAHPATDMSQPDFSNLSGHLEVSCSWTCYKSITSDLAQCWLCFILWKVLYYWTVVFTISLPEAAEGTLTIFVFIDYE